MKVSFAEYVRRVDAIVEARVGLRVNDLPDVPIRDWYDDGVSAKSALPREQSEAPARADQLFFSRRDQ